MLKINKHIGHYDALDIVSINTGKLGGGFA